MEKKQVLAGVKCVDFTWVAAGPQIGRTLAEHGATVVKVESHTRPDVLRRGVAESKDFIVGFDRSAHFATHNTNKYSVALDLAKPRAREVARKLIQWADVVSESYAPGVVKRLGVDYEEARKIKPDIIYCSCSMMGQSGPLASFRGMGYHAAALAGISELVAYPGGLSMLGQCAYLDYVAPWYAVMAVVGALNRRRKTGRGMYLDQAQLDVGPAFLAPAILDYIVNGRVARAMGSRDPYAAPHGAYRCQGDDSWVVIAVFTDAEWQGFCGAIGHPKWTTNPKFATLMNRKENEDELDALVEEWTVKHNADKVVELMQANGVPAGKVYKPEDLFRDPQLKHREHFVYMEHPVIGSHAYQNEAVRFSKTPPRFWRAAPCLGGDNEYVYKEILGFSDDEISDFLAEGVITTEADLEIDA